MAENNEAGVKYLIKKNDIIRNFTPNLTEDQRIMKWKNLGQIFFLLDKERGPVDRFELITTLNLGGVLGPLSTPQHHKR
ncbi:hypothetical protein JTE90_007525 [Oedothorax gibbosus]|uniref:Uncharacterized protein n=1 Tax=Oedothorax gibbosus TaxID=931172 RepID=A0AAV6VKT7_9ARAC|nr:hypothetical protein JTE90_007525 [Oedothorax gibbosus]